MNSSVILYAIQAPAAIITLNRPDKRNALNRQLITELHEAFERARDDTAARAVVLSATGPAFCAGMDLAELSQTLDQANEVELVRQDASRLSNLYELIYTLPKPTIAVVNGAAVAGGAGLVTVCDLAIAAPEARFGYPEVRRGLVAAMVMPHLLRHVGERTARELLLKGDLMDAEKALRAGLINAVAPASELSKTALEWAKSLAESGPGALATTKALLAQFNRRGVSQEDAAHGSAEARLTVECKEGLRAFLAKRPAPWA